MRKSNASGGRIDRYRSQTNSDKCNKSKKRYKSNDAVITSVYQQKGYPHLKNELMHKNASIDSAHHTGRKRSNSHCGSQHKIMKTSKIASKNKKFKGVNPMHNVSADNKMQDMTSSIEQNSLVTNERPSSAIKSMRISKSFKKSKKTTAEIAKESINESIEVPSIELQNQEKSYVKQKKPSNNVIYQKAAELIAQNLYKNLNKVQTANELSSSHKILKSASRGSKNKKSKEQAHRKSKSDANKFGQEFTKNSNTKSGKVNQSLRKANCIQQMFDQKLFLNMYKGSNGTDSPLIMPQS